MSLLSLIVNYDTNDLWRVFTSSNHLLNLTLMDFIGRYRVSIVRALKVKVKYRSNQQTNQLLILKVISWCSSILSSVSCFDLYRDAGGWIKKLWSKWLLVINGKCHLHQAEIRTIFHFDLQKKNFTKLSLFLWLETIVEAEHEREHLPVEVEKSFYFDFWFFFLVFFLVFFLPFHGGKWSVHKSSSDFKVKTAVAAA